MYRKTYALINHDILKSNVQEIIKTYNNYQYYIGVVKNNAYHHGMKIINTLISGGINYLAVSSLEEAMDARKYNIHIPILILEPINEEFIYDCINNNITITVENLSYLKKINDMNLPYELKIHLKIDSGMSRLGFKTAKELEESIKIMSENKKLVLEGIFTHFATSGINDQYWDIQLEHFKEITKNIDLSAIPIVHLGRSQTLVNHPKISFCNGIRLGIVMYGFSQSLKKDNSLKGKLRNLKNNFQKKKKQISETTIENDLKVKTAFSLYSTVISVRKINPGEFVGYNTEFMAKEETYIATIPIGFADGVDKKFGYVFIHNQKYQIIADCMDMIMIEVDETIKEGMDVEIFGKNITIPETTKRIGMNAYHLFNLIQNRVPRIHLEGKEQEEIKY